MRVVVQRVRAASVAWSDATGDQARSIGRGLVLLVGAGPESTPEGAGRLADKVANLRIFADAGGRTNLSLLEVGGQALAVSQFTLYADLSRGRRPSFIGAGDPERANRLYTSFVERLGAAGVEVATGSFGAEMLVTIENDGPMTIVLSTDGWRTEV